MDTRLARISPNDQKPESDESGWRLDLQIPVALLASMLLQSAVAVWWAAQIDSRVQVLEQQNATNTLLVERMSRVEEKILSLKESMQRVEGKLDRK